MYGCDNFCSYCIVPYVRGRERSRAPEAVLEEFRGLVKNGYRDITLLGQNVNSYGKNLEKPVNFSELLRMLDAVDGDYRIRFMTSHPKDASKELIDTIAASRHICHHIHLPFQSGSNRILKEMNRGYTREKYLKLISYAKSRIPGLSLTSDVIVGFPGETDAEFRETLDLIEKVGFTSLYTFIYSPREGTRAAKMPDPTPAGKRRGGCRSSARFRKRLRRSAALRRWEKPSECWWRSKIRRPAASPDARTETSWSVSTGIPR